MTLRRMNELGFEKISIWMTLVLVLSFSLTWNITILIQCYVVFFIVTGTAAFNLNHIYLMYLLYFADFFYLFEVIFSVTYLRNKKMRKLKYSKARRWFCVFIDSISLIPLELLFSFYYIDDKKNHLIRQLLLQNRSLRIYRFFLLDSLYMVSVRTLFKYVFFVFLQFICGSLLIAHVFACMWANVEKTVPCELDKFSCFIWYESTMVSLVLNNWSGKSESFQNHSERAIVTGVVLFGFFLIFAYIYPLTLYISLQLSYHSAVRYEKNERLLTFLNNMMVTGDLRNKIVNYFSDFWQKGQDSDVKTMFNEIPIAMQKEVFTDIYWEAFQHSELFRDVSRSCKRSLSLVMSTESHPSGEVIYYKGEEKLKMMYLVEGIIQIMADENDQSPLMSFSNGTVFGELSLFLCTRSTVILKCKGYCELQILSKKRVVSVLKNYPKDKKQIFHIINERLLMAKFTQWRKKTFIEEHHLEIFSSDFFSLKNCVKWLKTQWRVIWETHSRFKEMIKAREEGSRLRFWQKPVTADIKIEFISNYLDLIVLSDMFEEKKDVVCLRDTFPWSINPSASFLRLWYYVTMIASFIPALVYPLCTGWLDKFPWEVYLISYIVTLIFLIDLILSLLTASRTKHTLITNFFEVLRRKLQSMTFYFDVIAALPYQIYIILKVDFATAKAYHVGLPLQPAILKSHIFLTLRVPPGNYLKLLTVLKNTMMYFFFVYWLSELIQLYSILNLLNVPVPDDNWIKRALELVDEDEYVRNYFLSVMRALVVTVSIPDPAIYPDENTDFLTSCFFKYFFFMFFCFYLGDYYRALTIKMFGWESFRVLTQRLAEFLRTKYVSESIASRILRDIKFQWDYDRGDFITSNASIIKSMPLNLRKSLHSMRTYDTLKACPLFEQESEEFIMEIAEKSDLLAVPPGAILVAFGQTCHAVSVISRGYCQLNSFFKKDVTANLGRSMVLGPSSAFPILSSFCNAPAPISVVTVTDCELIWIDLNDLLTILMKDNYLKDLVDVLQKDDLPLKVKSTKPALMQVHLHKTPQDADRMTNLEIYRKTGFCGKLLYLCCPKKNIFIKHNLMKYWDLMYAVNNVALCFLWPFCFGLLPHYSNIIFPVVTLGKIILFFHMIVRCQLPYYNKKGLLVTHPAYTSANYFKSSFFLDFLKVFPFLVIYHYGFFTPYRKPSLYVILIGCVQFGLNLLDVVQYIDFKGRETNKRYYTVVLKITLMLCLCLNLAVNIALLLYSNWHFTGPQEVSSIDLNESVVLFNKNLVREGNVADYYLLMSNWLISCWNSLDFEIQELKGSQLYLSYALSYFGTIANFFMYASLCSNSTVANIFGATYQEKLSSLIKFLKFQKTDEKLIEKMVSHYNYKWSKTQGENFREIFKHLPLYLHEELWYPMYRPTFKKNYIFEKANEGFFKMLSVHVTSLFFTRGTVILFKNQVQSDIYLVHRGKCFVYDWFLVMETGSILGDIKRTHLMQNKVYALTNVELLQISSNDFFTILNSFDDLEANFFYNAKKAENFIKSDVYRLGQSLRHVDSKDGVNAFDLQRKDIRFEDESHFEDPDNYALEAFKVLKRKPKNKFQFTVIYPNTWQMDVYIYGYLTITVLTIICLSTFLVYGGLTIEAFIIVGILDFFWLIYMILTFRVGILNEKTGDVITKLKLIAGIYGNSFDGLFLDLLAGLPFELIVLAISGSLSRTDVDIVSFFRMFRFIRVYSFSRYIRLKISNLKADAYRKSFLELMIFLLNLFLLTNAFTYITWEPSIVAARDPHSFKKDQFLAFLLSLQYMTNFLASSNISVISPSSRGELLFINVTSLIFTFLKGHLICRVLSVLYVKNLATSYYKAQVSDLESYLVKKDASPFIIEQVIYYKTKLLQFSLSENMPGLLTISPMTLQISIMKDLYIQHLENCPLFEGVDDVFLSQLVVRAKREVYFPGQLIAEQGDVDNQMFFIHKGEVYVISPTKDKAYVEHVVGRMYAGEAFGEPQGICIAKPHSHTYRGRTLVEMLVLHTNNWADLRNCFPNTTQKIYDKAKALRYI